jgi:hypothetical protein
MNLRFSPAAGFALLLCLPLSLAAQDEPAPAMAPTMTSTTAMPRVDQADALLAPLEYHSVFLDYIPFQPAELLPWLDANARVAGASGHAGHGSMPMGEHAQHGHTQHDMGGAK